MKIFMSEVEIDNDSSSRAERLSSELIRDLRRVSMEGAPIELRREVFSERRYAEQAEGVPINDVVANVDQMAVELAFAHHHWGDAIPFLKLNNGELALISLSELFGAQNMQPFDSDVWLEFWDRYLGFPPFERLWRNIYRHTDYEEKQIIMTSFGEAHEGLQRSLNGFLSFRFAGIKKWNEWIHGMSASFNNQGGGHPTSSNPNGNGVSPPPAVGAGGYLQVQVSCLTKGLRIHISPSYFISWVYFGSPTSPVTSYVLPGRYVFAGDGPNLKRKRDNGVFNIPPDYRPSLVRF